MMKHIFDPFFTTKRIGTGLDLSISFDIVRKHNGRIEVKSTPDKETTFRVWLPVQQDNRNKDSNPQLHHS